MRQEDRNDRPDHLLDAYGRARFGGSEMPEGFIDNVRGITRIRRKRRHQRQAAASALAALIIVTAIFQVGNRTQLFEQPDILADQMLFEVSEVETYLVDEGIELNTIAEDVLGNEDDKLYELYAERTVVWGDADLPAALDDEELEEVWRTLETTKILDS
ncbi:hypothetical protein GF324_04220 [bacterium]|nr:hypothetical protein [bacterium]